MRLGLLFMATFLTAVAAESDKLSDPFTVIERLTQPEPYFLAMASVVRLDNGKLLSLHERQPSWVDGKRPLGPIVAMQFVKVSGDDGQTWQDAGRVGPMHWPEVFSTSTGVYVIGNKGHYGRDNGVVVCKMLDSNGAKWSQPTQITKGLSVLITNNGVEISGGRVIKALEVVPDMSSAYNRAALTAITAPVTVYLSSDLSPTQRLTQFGGPNLEVVHAPVVSAERLVWGQQVRCTHPSLEVTVYFRVVAIDVEGQEVQLRPEGFNIFLSQDDVAFPAGTEIWVSGGDPAMYGNTDWWMAVLEAPDDADLLDPSVWVLSNPVGSPAAVHSVAAYDLLGVRNDWHGNPLPKRTEGLKKVKNGLLKTNDLARRNAGLGALFHMESMAFRLQDKRSGDGSLQVMMRVTNNFQCDLAAIAVVHDGAPSADEQHGGPSPRHQRHPLPQPHAQFLRYGFVPGLSIAHGALRYDPVSDLYWYVNNVSRDSQRNWKNGGAAQGTKNLKGIKVSPAAVCNTDRSALGLFYSANGFDWLFSGFVDYFVEPYLHFTYPCMIIDGNDLIITSRSTVDDMNVHRYNNHDSSSIVMHRVRDFRRHALTDWVGHMTNFETMPSARRYPEPRFKPGAVELLQSSGSTAGRAGQTRPARPPPAVATLPRTRRAPYGEWRAKARARKEAGLAVG